MNTAQLQTLCGQFPGAKSIEYGHPDNVLIFLVGSKQFAYFKTSEPEKWRFSVRVTPDRFLELTDIDGVRPARYMSRFHWVTVTKTGAISSAYLRELVKWSYDKAFASLTKAQRATVSGSRLADG